MMATKVSTPYVISPLKYDHIKINNVITFFNNKNSYILRGSDPVSSTY